MTFFSNLSFFFCFLSTKAFLVPDRFCLTEREVCLMATGNVLEKRMCLIYIAVKGNMFAEIVQIIQFI